MRRTFSAFLLAILAACSSQDGADLSGSGRGGGKLFSPIEAAARARVVAGAPLILATIIKHDLTSAFVKIDGTGQLQTWRTVNNVSLTFSDQLLSSTRGVGADLMSANLRASAKLVLQTASGRAVRVHYYSDGQYGVVAHSYVCDITPRGARQIGFDGRQFTTTLMQETCTNPDSTFENLYWVQDGQILQSRQWVSDESGSLAIRKVIR